MQKKSTPTLVIMLTHAPKMRFEKAIIEAGRTVLLTVVAAVAAYDVYCCQWLTPEYELNPLFRLIMVQWGLWVAVGCKVFGTFLALEILHRVSIWYSVLAACGMLVLFLTLIGVIPC